MLDHTMVLKHLRDILAVSLFAVIGCEIGLAFLVWGVQFIYGTPPHNICYDDTRALLARIGDKALLRVVGLFTLSVTLIPLATLLVEHFNRTLRRRAFLVFVACIWLVTILLSTIEVKFVGPTLAEEMWLPYWYDDAMVSTCLLLVPSFAICGVLILGLLGARWHAAPSITTAMFNRACHAVLLATVLFTGVMICTLFVHTLDYIVLPLCLPRLSFFGFELPQEPGIAWGRALVYWLFSLPCLCLYVSCACRWWYRRSESKRLLVC